MLLSDWILADIHLNGVPGVPAVNIYWHAEGVLAVFPLHGTRYRVIADVGESSGTIGEGHRPTPTVEDVQRTLEARGPGGIQASDPVWLSSFSISERKVRTTAQVAFSLPEMRHTSTAPRVARG